MAWYTPFDKAREFCERLPVPAFVNRPATRIRAVSLMYGFYLVMRGTAMRSQVFADRIAEKDTTFAMTLKDTGDRRYFTYSGGKVRTSLKGPEKPDFTLIWKDAPSGARVMTDMMFQKPKVLMKAVMAGDLLLDGDAALIGWFLETLNTMLRALKNKPPKTAA